MKTYCSRHYGDVDAGPGGGCKWCERDREYSVAHAATPEDAAAARDAIGDARPTTCPVCHGTIGPRDGVATDGTTTVHGRCHGKMPFAPNPDNDEYEAAGDVVVLAPLIPPGRFPSPSRHTVEAMTANIREQLMVGIREIVPAARWPEADAWADDRARNIVMSIVGNFAGDCRNCGSVPLREASDFTDEMPTRALSR